MTLQEHMTPQERMKTKDEVREFWKNNPTETSKKVAEMFGITDVYARCLKHSTKTTQATAFKTLQKLVEEKDKEIEKLKTIIRTLIE